MKNYYVRLTDITKVTRHVDIDAATPAEAATAAIEQERYSGLLGDPCEWVVRVYEPCPTHNILEACEAK